MNEELLKLIEMGVANGYSQSEMLEVLPQEGHDPKAVASALNEYFNPKKKSQNGASQSTGGAQPSSSAYQPTSVASPTEVASTIQWGPTEFRQGLGAGMQGSQAPKQATADEEVAARKKAALEARDGASLDIAKIIVSTGELSNEQKDEVSRLYDSYKQADANLEGASLMYDNIFSEDGSINPSVYNYVAKSATTALDKDAKRELENARRLGGESVFERSLNSLGAGVDGIIGGVAMGLELLKDMAPTPLGMPLYTGKSAVGEFGTETLMSSAKTMNNVFLAAGYTQEDIEKGSLGMTMEGDLGMLYYSVLQQVPQLALVAATGGTAGIGVLGLSSAGGAYDEVYYDPSFTPTEKMLYGTASGVVEAVSERIFMTDIRALRSVFGSADDIAKLSRREFAEKFMPKLTKISNAIPGLVKGTAEEAFEEGLVAVTQEALKYALDEKKEDFDTHDIAESMFLGAVMGGGIHSIAYGPSALLNSSLIMDKYKIRNKIQETQAILNDPTLSEQEKGILQEQLNTFIRKEREMKDSAAKYYENWDEADIKETQRLNQVINKGLKNYQGMRSNVAKDAVMAEVQEAFNAKQEIEKRYDSQAKGQVPSGVQGGEATQQGQPVKGPSAETAPTGGVLQVPEQTQQAAQNVKVRSVKVNQENVGAATNWLTDWVNSLSESDFLSSGKQQVLDGIQSLQNVVNFMVNNGRDVNVVAHTNADSFKNATGLDRISRGYYISETDGANQIHVFVPAMMSNTGYHEGIHEILPEVIGPEGVKKLGSRLWQAVKGDKGLYRQMQSFMSAYEGMDETDLADEFLTELGSLIADGSIEIEVVKSLGTKFMESVAEFMNAAFGTNVQPTNAQLAQALISLGESIGTGAKYTKPDFPLPKPGKTGGPDITGLFPSSKAQEITEQNIYNNSYTDEFGYEYSYVVDDEEFKQMVDAGIITINNKFSDFTDKPIIVHQPDNAFTGEIRKDGKVVMTGKGGLFAPVYFSKEGLFWLSTKNAANSLAKKLNKAAEMGDGVIRMMLTTGKPDKVLSSTIGSKGVVEFLVSKVLSENFAFNETQMLASIIKGNQNVIALQEAENKKKLDEWQQKKAAAEAEGKPFKNNPPKGKPVMPLLKEGAGLNQVLEEVYEFLKPDKSTFDTRKAFVTELLGGIVENVTEQEEVLKLRNLLGIETRGGKISKSSLVDAFSRIQTEPLLKGMPTGVAYAVLEIEGPVEAVDFAVEQGGHDSYPTGIRSINGNPTKIKMLGKATAWFDNVYDTSKGRSFDTEGNAKQVEKSTTTVLPTTSGMSEVVVLNPSKKTIDRLEKEYPASSAQIKKYTGDVAKAKYGKAQELSPAPESSNLNTYQVSTYLHTAMGDSMNNFKKNSLENLKNRQGVAMHDGGYFTPVKSALASKYRDSSKYFEAYFSSVKTGKKVKLKIRVSDHEVPVKEVSRAAEYPKEGINRLSDRRDKETVVNINIWNKETYNKAEDYLKSLGFAFVPAIDPSYFVFNNRSRQAIDIQDELAQILFSETGRDKDGNIVVNRSLDEFLKLAELYGVPYPIAEAMYNQNLEGKLSMKVAGTSAIDNTYEDYLDKTQSLMAKAFTFYEKLKKNFIDRQAVVKAYLVSAGLDNVRQLLVNRSGASAYAKYLFDAWDTKVYGKMSQETQVLLDKIIFLRRVIQIDAVTDSRKQVAVNELLMLEQALVAKQDEMANSPASEYVKLKKEEKAILDDIEVAKENIKAINRVAHPRAIGSASWNKESAEAQLLEIKNKIGAEQYDDLINRSDEYFNAFRELLGQMKEGGLISQDEYDSLVSFDYQPRMFVMHVFNNVEDDVAVRDYGLSQAQIKKLRNGSTSELLMDSRLILSLYSKSVTSRVAKNRANMALAKGLQNPRNNDWLLPNPNVEAAVEGFENVYYYKDGEQFVFQMRSDLKREWDDVGSILSTSSTMQKIMGYASGSFALKLLATRANPLFVLRNLPRDYFHILFFTDTYGSTPLPVAMIKLAGDFYRGLKSKLTDDTDFQDYVRLGGAMDFLSTEGRPSQYNQSKWGRASAKFLDYTSRPGEYSEIGFRIAVYKKMVENGVSEFEKSKKRQPTKDELEMIKSRAVTASREVIDFSQGGSFTKGAEIVTPYLNSAFQGMRVSWDYIKANPKQFASRLAQMQFGMVALMLMNYSLGDDDMEDIPEETKKRYFIIMTPFTEKDKNGKIVRKYIKIAKTQQMIPFFSLSEIAADQIISNMFNREPKFTDDALKYAINGIAAFLPKDITKLDKELLSSVPLMSAVMTYTTNYDSFREQVIEKNFGEVLPETEGLFDKDIPYFYKVIGDLTEMSPKRLQVATEKLVTSPYSSALVGGAYSLLDAFASPYVIEGKYDKDGQLAMSENFTGKMQTMLPKAFSIGTTNPNWRTYNIADEINKINQREGSVRKEILQTARIYAEKYRAAETDKQRNEITRGAEVVLKEMNLENPMDARYFRASFRTAAMISGSYQPFTNEIKYAASDKARAEIMRIVLEQRGGFTRADVVKLREDLRDDAGYEIPASTFRLYQSMYGQIK